MNQILTQTVVALARKPVACAVQSTDDAGGLLPDEEALIAKAVARRRSEFAAGRRSARDALATLGCPVRPLMIGALPQPLWPAGFNGSNLAIRLYMPPIGTTLFIGLDRQMLARGHDA